MIPFSRLFEVVPTGNMVTCVLFRVVKAPIEPCVPGLRVSDCLLSPKVLPMKEIPPRVTVENLFIKAIIFLIL